LLIAFGAVRGRHFPDVTELGSSGKTKFEMRNGKWVLMRLPEMSFIDDGPDNPVGIHAVTVPALTLWRAMADASDDQLATVASVR
jgi:hypothetical protein